MMCTIHRVMPEITQPRRYSMTMAFRLRFHIMKWKHNLLTMYQKYANKPFTLLPKYVSLCLENTGLCQSNGIWYQLIGRKLFVFKDDTNIFLNTRSLSDNLLSESSHQNQT